MNKKNLFTLQLFYTWKIKLYQDLKNSPHYAGLRDKTPSAKFQ